MPLTLEEYERRAYIERHTEIARILGEAIDGVGEEVLQLRHDNEQLEATIRELENEVQDLYQRQW